MKENSVAEKVIVITGASSGAGWAMATRLAEKGATLILAARREQALEEVGAECRHLGATVHLIPTDTKDTAAVHALAVAAMAITGRIDVWINNAGVLAAGSLEDIPAAVNEAVIQTNLLGYIQGAHAVIPIFKEQGRGILINNISVGGWIPTPYMAAYCASKFGLQGFSEALRGELHQYPHIHVCNLFPGFLDTPGMQHAANYTGKELMPSPPLTDPRELANAVVKLIRHPQQRATAGVFPHLVRLAYRLLPSVTRNITAGMIRTYLEGAKPIEKSSGNVLHPVAYGTGADGAWRTVGMKPAPRKALWLAASIGAGLAVLSALKR